MQRGAIAALSGFVFITAMCNVGLSQNWDWVESFDTGMNGWVAQQTDDGGHVVSSAWHWEPSKLVYTEVADFGFRAIRHPQLMATTNGFVMEADINISQMASPVTQVGLMFGATADMSDAWGFYAEKDFQWHLIHHVPGLTYDYGYGYVSSSTNLFHVFRVEYDGLRLKCYVDGNLAKVQDTWPWGQTIPNGYVGLNIWDSNNSGTVEVSEVRFAAIPEPTTWSLLALGAVALLGGLRLRCRTS